ncbi:hypothetical protein SAMN04487995_5920 [Dyadobacter koreensis]|uniref:Uncharacterized protein n=1 Tax=Dyadobacter koreensis TaxID=408657 RepID=A0A1H7B2T9_9BACT|nr:hypothetical protein SAMN04487995_5920 [Dyadobacter koreensis]
MSIYSNYKSGYIVFSIKEDAEGYFIISHDSNIYSVRSLRTGEVYYHHSDY